MNISLGMIGLGVMGCNLLLNMADHGFNVAGYDTDSTKVNSLLKANHQHVTASTDLHTFLNSLSSPRMIMLLVPAGAAVDSVIQALLPHLQPDDCVIDGGNSYFKDSLRRADTLATHGIHFLSVGISGGESGARHGPSIMPSGPITAYQRVQAIFETIAAIADQEPCVSYLGTGAVGHFVKMVHNGIEYGLMQLLAESYHFLTKDMNCTHDQLAAIYSQWNQGALASYLLEITTDIVNTHDPLTGKQLLDSIASVARQKGTGLWTSMSAMELHVPIPTIDSAVAMRDMSVLTEQRLQAAALYPQTPSPVAPSIATLADALYSAMLITYAQGFALLKNHDPALNLAAVARLWRGGCIIRAELLDDLVRAFEADSNLANALLAPHIAELLNARLMNFRVIVSHAALSGLSLPGMMASLSYLDAYRSDSPANLIAAQRDYFGAHGYERHDRPGTFHTVWMTAND